MGSKDTSKKVKSSSSRKQKAPEPSKTNTSAEYVADSDRDSEVADSDTEDSLPEKPSAKAPEKANGSKKSKGKPKEVAPPVESSSEEEGSEESDSGDKDEEKDNSDSEEEAATEPTPKPSQNETPQTQTPEPSKPAAKYELPKGFEPLPAPLASAPPPKVASLLSKTHTSNKKVFHFTTPASVPIEALKHLKYDNIEAGKISFSYKGNEYEVGGEEIVDGGEEEKIMVAKDGSRNYSISKHLKPTKTLHFRQTVPSALLASNSSNPKATVPKKRPARAQPEGLRIRFRSGEIGTESGSNESEDESD